MVWHRSLSVCQMQVIYIVLDRIKSNHCPKKYAFTCQQNVLLGFKWNIIKHTIFQGQVIVGVGQVNVEALLGKLPQKLMLCLDVYKKIKSS